MKLFISDNFIQNSFLRLNDQSLAIASLIYNFLIYDQIYIATYSFRELDLLFQHFGKKTITELILSNRLVFVIESNWGVGFLNRWFLEDFEYYGDKTDPKNYLSTGCTDELEGKWKNKHRGIHKLVIEHSIDRGYLNMYEDIDKYCKLAIKSANKYIPKKDNLIKIQGLLTMEATQHAHFIRDIDYSMTLNAHMNLDDKSKWWAIKKRINDTKIDLNEYFDNPITQLFRIPNLSETIKKGAITPKSLLLATNEDWASEFRVWLADEMSKEISNINSASIFDKMLNRWNKNKDVVKWLSLNAITNIPIAGPILGVVHSFYEMMKTKGKNTWKPKIYLGSKSILENYGS